MSLKDSFPVGTLHVNIPAKEMTGLNEAGDGRGKC
jgi:hypothetical protein